MLNFKALDNTYNKVKNDIIAEAEKCSEDIKAITQKFIEYNIGYGANHVWQEEGGNERHTMMIDCGIYWDANSKKILFWVDDPESATVLLGENARTRATVRPKLQKLIDKAVLLVNKEREMYLGHTDEEMKKKELVNLMETHLALKDVLDMPRGEHSEVDDEPSEFQKELEAMSDEEYDEYIYKEPEHGGPSIADEMLTNGNK